MTRDREWLRAGFDRVAPLYERVRPSYPVAMFDDLAELAGVGPGCRVLEIGCGTGQASVSLAERGVCLLAVELGARLADIATTKLARFPDARVVVADFDRWCTNEPPFDVVFAATAFHWLDPETKFARTAALLAPGGALATVATFHVAGGTERFFAEVQRCYERFDPDVSPNWCQPTASEVAPDGDLGEPFGEPIYRRYEWTADYTTADYLDLLRTYSGTHALPTRASTGLLRCIGELIDGRYTGRITKHYLTELRIARPRNR